MADYTFEISFDVTAAVQTAKHSPARRSLGMATRIRMQGSFAGPGQWWALVKPSLLLPAQGTFTLHGNTCLLRDLKNQGIATLRNFSYDVLSGPIDIVPDFLASYHAGWRPIAGKSGQWTTLSHEYGHGKDAMEFVDDAGVNVLDRFGSKVLRPVKLDPHDILRAARADAKAKLPGVAEAWDESNFGRGSKWDAQRLNGNFQVEFLDYATILIGIYFAGPARPMAESLKTQNDVAKNGHYEAWIVKDGTYTSLPVRNVENTKIGCALVTLNRLVV